MALASSSPMSIAQMHSKSTALRDRKPVPQRRCRWKPRGLSAYCVLPQPWTGLSGARDRGRKGVGGSWLQAVCAFKNVNRKRKSSPGSQGLSQLRERSGNWTDRTRPVGTVDPIPWTEGEVPQPPASLHRAAGAILWLPFIGAPTTNPVLCTQ